MISFWASRLVTGSHSKQSSWRKLLGAFRYLAYRRYKVAGYLTPSLGVVLLLASGALFFSGMHCKPPDFRQVKGRRLTDGHSDDLGTRASLLARYHVWQLASYRHSSRLDGSGMSAFHSVRKHPNATGDDRPHWRRKLTSMKHQDPLHESQHDRYPDRSLS